MELHAYVTSSYESKFLYFDLHIIHSNSLEEDTSCDKMILESNIFLLTIMLLMQWLISIDRDEIYSSQLEKFHLHLVRLWTPIELKCVEDVGTFLLINMSLLRGEYVKKMLCKDSHHMILMFVGTAATCFGDVRDHIELFISILELVYAFVCWSSIFFEHFETYKNRSGYYTLCYTHESNDQENYVLASRLKSSYLAQILIFALWYKID